MNWLRIASSIPMLSPLLCADCRPRPLYGQSGYDVQAGLCTDNLASFPKELKNKLWHPPAIEPLMFKRGPRRVDRGGSLLSPSPPCLPKSGQTQPGEAAADIDHAVIDRRGA